MFLSTEDKDILGLLENFSPFIFSIAILMVIIPWFANTLRLFIWIRFLGTKLSFIRTFKIIILSEFGAALSPSAVGSAPVKAGLLIQEKMTPGTAFSLATITSLEDFTFFIIAIPTALTISSAWELSVINTFFEKLQTKLPWVLGLFFLVVLIIFLIKILKTSKNQKSQNNRNSPHLFIKKIMEKGQRAWGDFKRAYSHIGKKGKIRFAVTTTLTGIQWICRYSVITALVASLGFNSDPVLFFGLQWIVFALSIFIPTPGATGGAEVSFYLIFYSFLPHESIGLITAGWRFVAFYGFLGIGTLLYFSIHLLEKAAKQSHTRTEFVLNKQNKKHLQKSPIIFTDQ